jgi:hypothetical protein
MPLKEILNFQTLEQKDFFQRLQNIKKEVRKESFEHGKQYFSFLLFYQLSDTVKKLHNSKNLNYFIGIDSNTNSEFIFTKINEHQKDLQEGKEIDIMALDYDQFHYVNYKIFQNKENEIEIKLYDSLISDRKDNDTGNILLTDIKKFYETGINFFNGKKIPISIFNSDGQFLEYDVWKNMDSGKMQYELDPIYNDGRKIDGDLNLLIKKTNVFNCISNFNQNLKFSIGYSPQQHAEHFNCGEHSFTQNSLKEFIKNEKLFKFFPIINYTEKQNNMNVIFAFLIEIFIFFRKLFTGKYKEDTQKMFKLIEIIFEISILEQNSKIILKTFNIDFDILKELKNEILNEIKKEFQKNQNNYSIDQIKEKLYILFKNKILEKLSEQNIESNNLNIQNALNELNSYEYLDENNKSINKNKLISGVNTDLLVKAIDFINKERGK